MIELFEITEIEMNELIEELETLATYYGNDFEGKETKEHATLTAAANRLAEYEEMLGEAWEIYWSDDTSIVRLGDKWVTPLPTKHDHPLEAFKAIGGKENGSS